VRAFSAAMLMFAIATLAASGMPIMVLGCGVLVPVLGGYANAISALSVMYLLGFLATRFGRETRGVSQTL
jgi:hypothetical protein